MKDILRRFKPSSIEHLRHSMRFTARTARGGMIDDFINESTAQKKWSKSFNELKQVLAETYGVIVYQEQVMLDRQQHRGYSAR
jgi:DNA polymerase-3 subunit alpha